MAILAYFVWDPSPEIFHFNLPFLGRPLLWYGCLFAAGFFAAYGVLLYLMRRYFVSSSPSIPQLPSSIQLTDRSEINLAVIKGKSSRDESISLSNRSVRVGLATGFAEKLSFYVMIGAVAGARLGDLLFYQDWHQVIRHPLSLIAIWEGGLSSHGGALGIIAALLLFSKRHHLLFWKVLDFVVIPTALAAVFIRVGNFFNQEILGTPTTLPFAVLFLHPADRGAVVPRHPAQLYEACLYLFIFLILFWDWHKRPPFEKIGRSAGLFLIFVFGSRFLIEFLKVEQSVYLQQGAFLTMGQWLSFPFIILGGWLFRRSLRAMPKSDS